MHLLVKFVGWPSTFRLGATEKNEMAFLVAITYIFSFFFFFVPLVLFTSGSGEAMNLYLRFGEKLVSR